MYVRIIDIKLLILRNTTKTNSNYLVSINSVFKIIYYTYKQLNLFSMAFLGFISGRGLYMKYFIVRVNRKRNIF